MPRISLNVLVYCPISLLNTRIWKIFKWYSILVLDDKSLGNRATSLAWLAGIVKSSKLSFVYDKSKICLRSPCRLFKDTVICTFHQDTSEGRAVLWERCERCPRRPTEGRNAALLLCPPRGTWKLRPLDWCRFRLPLNGPLTKGFVALCLRSIFLPKVLSSYLQNIS